MADDAPSDFIREIVDADLRSGKHQRVATRFPPEPNGYLHIGHAKSICLNFGLAREFGGTCNLRFDDTNPTKEDVEYVESIQERRALARLRLGRPRCSTPPTTSSSSTSSPSSSIARGQGLRRQPDRRGDPRVPRHARPSRDGRARTATAPVAENLDLFRRMRAGEFPDGAHVLRAKIDMASPNMNMRDPAALPHPARAPPPHRRRVVHLPDVRLRAPARRTRIEGITHSICTLEFEDHRAALRLVARRTAGRATAPQQIEFARLNLTYTVMSKRKLLAARARAGTSAGWDDPRMPTLAGLRRRGYTPEAIRAFCARIGVAKREQHRSTSAHARARVREDLNQRAPRVMAVLRPLKVVIENYPEGQVEELDAVNNPGGPVDGHAQGAVLPRALHRARRLPRGAAAEVLPPRRRAARCGCATRYLITCTGVVKDDARRGRRAALHLRSGDARRQRARRPQGEGHAPLGIGGARGRRRGAALRPALRRRGARAARTSWRSSTRSRSRCCAAASSSRALADAAPGQPLSSSSASATSASIRRIHGPAPRCSTAP